MDHAADDYRNSMSATWRWAQSTASFWDEHYWNAHTRAYVSDLLADACAHAGIQGRIAVLFEQHDPLRIGELLHRHHHSPAPVTIWSREQALFFCIKRDCKNNGV